MDEIIGDENLKLSIAEQVEEKTNEDIVAEIIKEIITDVIDKPIASSSLSF